MRNEIFVSYIKSNECTWVRFQNILRCCGKKKYWNDKNTLLKICVLWDLICASWYVCEGLWSPRFFHFRVEKSLGVSPLWSIKRYRNFKSLLQNESLYSSLHLLKAVGSQGRQVFPRVKGTINVSETFVALCIAFIFFCWEIEKAPLKLSLVSLYVQQNADPIHLFFTQG